MHSYASTYEISKPYNDTHKKTQKNKNVIHLCLSYPLISLFFAFLLLFATWPLFLVLFLWITTVCRLSYYFTHKKNKISLAEALCGMLALMPANQVLAKDIRLEIVV